MSGTGSNSGTAAGTLSRKSSAIQGGGGGGGDRRGSQTSLSTLSSSVSSIASASSTSSATATLRQGNYRIPLQSAPVRFPGMPSASSRPASVAGSESGFPLPSPSATRSAPIKGPHLAPPPNSSTNLSSPGSITGGGVFGASTPSSSASMSQTASSSTAPSSTAPTPATAPGAGASVAAFAPAPPPPINRARPPNAANLLETQSSSSSLAASDSNADAEGRTRTRSGGLSALKAILGAGGTPNASSNTNNNNNGSSVNNNFGASANSARSGSTAGSGWTTPRTRTDTPSGSAVGSSTPVSSRHQSRVASPERTTSRSGMMGSQDSPATPSGADPSPYPGLTPRSRRGGPGDASMTGSSPMTRPNSKVLTTFPFPHPSNHGTGPSSGIGYVLRSPRPSASFLANNGNSAQNSPAAGTSNGSSPAVVPGGADLSSQFRAVTSAAGQMMQDRIRQGQNQSSSADDGKPQPSGRQPRRSFGLGLGLGFRSKGTEGPADAKHKAGADQSIGSVADFSTGRSLYPNPPFASTETVNEPSYNSSPEATSPVNNPSASTAYVTSHPQPAPPPGTNLIRGLTTLATLPLTILVPTLEVDWGSLPFGLGEHRRRQAEDEANTREAEEILAAQVRLFQERRAVPLLASQQQHPQQHQGRGGGPGAAAGPGQSGLEPILRSSTPMGGKTANAGAGGANSMSASNQTQGGVESGSRPPSLNNANYGAIMSAPAGTGTDLEPTALLTPKPTKSFFFGAFTRDKKGKDQAEAPTNHRGQGKSGGGANETAALLPSGTGAQRQQEYGHRTRGISMSSTSSDPSDPYGYRALAGPALLPLHAEHLERRNLERRRAARREVTRRWTGRLIILLILVLFAWLFWIYALQGGQGIGWDRPGGEALMSAKSSG